ncbi:MAG: sugar phosphate isomerase/epimerase [Planctomycetota bacterium]|nr:MAG: sugar phosphate isomerase/epimerase [Planctomycetota bacterium]
MVLFGYNSNGFCHHRLPEALDWLAELGYQAVAITPDVGCLDPATTTTAEVEAVASQCRHLGLTPVLETGARYCLDPRRKHRPNLLEVGDDWRRRLVFLEKMLAWGNVLEAGVLSFWSGALPSNQTPSGAWARLLQALEWLAPLAEKYGVALALEPEPGHFVDTVDVYEELQGRFQGPLGLSLDVGHLLVTGEMTPEQGVERFADSILNLQLDDMRVGVHHHLVPGEGEVDWEPLVAAIQEYLPENLPACLELSRDSHRFHELAPSMMNWARIQGLSP